MKNRIRNLKERASGRILAGYMALKEQKGEGFVDTAIKILMAVVIGALVLAGLYALFDETVLPTLPRRVQEMFSYSR